MPWVIAGLALLWTYLGLSAAAPGIVGGDAPELTSAAYHWGSAHAPGYPLYITLGHLFQALPLGTEAFRTTLLSILAQVLAWLVLALTLRGLLADQWTGNQKWGIALVAASLTLAGPLVFHQMVSPEVFALHLLFVSLLMFCFMNLSLKGYLRTCFLLGLAVTNQHLTLLVVPALVWRFRSFLLRPKWFAYGTCLAVLGLTPYLVLPMRAQLHPLANWGNPVHLQQFLWHLTRAQYGGDLSGGKFLNGFVDLWIYLVMFFKETYGLGLVLAVIGAIYSRGRLNFAYWLGGIGLLIVLPFLLRSPYDIENNIVNSQFLAPAILWAAPLLVLGIQKLLEWAGSSRNWLFTGLVLATLMVMGLSAKSLDASRNLAVEDIGRDILYQMPSKAVLYSEGDAITFPLAYLKLVKNFRPDLEIYDRTGGLFTDLYHLLDYQGKKQMSPQEWVTTELDHEKDRPAMPVYYTESAESPGRPLTMTGLLFQVLNGVDGGNPDRFWQWFVVPRVEPTHDYLSRESGARFHLFKATFDQETRRDPGMTAQDLAMTKRLAYDDARLWLNTGLFEANHGMVDQGVMSYQKALECAPSFALAWCDLGVAMGQQGRTTEAVSAFEKAVAFEPQNPDYHHHLAYQYFKEQKQAEAAREWETTIQLDPNFADAYKDLGYLEVQRNPEIAAERLRQYLGLVPNTPERAGIEKWLAGQGH